jgi:hypothetical protein
MTMLTILQARLNRIMDQWNEQIVDPMVVENFGRRYKGIVRIVAAPLSDSSTEFFRTLYNDFLSSDSEEATELRKTIDYSAIQAHLDIPTKIPDQLSPQKAELEAEDAWQVAENEEIIDEASDEAEEEFGAEEEGENEGGGDLFA